MSVDPRFFEHLGPAPLSELAALSGADCKVYGDRRAASVGTTANATSEEICYYDGAKPPGENAINPEAAGCFVQAKFADLLPARVAALVSDFPRHAHTLAARRLLRIRGWDEVEHEDRPTHIHETAHISPGAHIGAGAAVGERTVVGPNAVIGPGVQIGRDCVIGANVSLQCALIGNAVKVYSGARIGEAGFGVAAGPTGAEDTPQYGRVILQDGVTVGANSCIDRGAFDDTILGENSKIDNLCQIGHNVVIGRNVMLASFAGISGSVVIGDGVKFGGRVGIADHVVIGENAQIAASAGVFREIPAGETWGGVPARPVRQWMREIAWVQKQTNGGKRKS